MPCKLEHILLVYTIKMNFISYKGIKSFAMSSYFLGLIAKYGPKGATTKIFGKVNKFILGEIILMVHLIQTDIMSYQAWIVPLHCNDNHWTMMVGHCNITQWEPSL